MKGWAWIIGLITFIALLMYPIGVVVWLRGMEGTSVGGIISVFLVLVGCVQFGTVGYAFLKPGLGMVCGKEKVVGNGNDVKVAYRVFFGFVM